MSGSDIATLAAGWVLSGLVAAAAWVAWCDITLQRKRARERAARRDAALQMRAGLCDDLDRELADFFAAQLADLTELEALWRLPAREHA